MVLLTALGVWEISEYHFQTCSAKETHEVYIYHKIVYGTPRNTQEFAYSEMWQEVSTNRDREAMCDNSLPSPWLTREVNPFLRKNLSMLFSVLLHVGFFFMLLPVVLNWLGG